MSKISPEIVTKLMTDRKVRVAVTRQDIAVFFSFYFAKYIKYGMAPFQLEILSLLQDERNKTIVITAFRNSAKSTFCSLVLPIWSAIGIHQKKNILLVCQTEQKAEQTLINIRRELEVNKTLVSDHGIFYSSNDEWNKRTLVIAKYGVRITVVSVSESVRGVRHDEHRPDLIIYDDLEDALSAKTQEGRDKLWQIVTREFMPLGTKDTRHIFIGNLVHPDATMVRLKHLIQSGRMSGVYREYPLIKHDVIMWPGQFPNLESIEELKKQQPSEIDFLREYMLLMVPDGNQLIFPKDIKRYDEKELIPRMDFKMYLILIDPAVSGERSLRHDKTGIITARVYGSHEKLKIYISSNPVNDWLEWPEIIERVKNIVSSFGSHATYKILVEGGSTQKGLTQMLVYQGLNAEEITPHGNDKRTRISMLVPWLANKVLFPISGTEELEHQLIYFGAERYDDLVDSLTLISLAMPEIEKSFVSNFQFISKGNVFRSQNNFVNQISIKDWAEEDDRQMFSQLRTPKRFRL